MTKLIGQECGHLMNLACEISKHNHDKITIQTLIVSLELACQFKKESEKVFDKYFPDKLSTKNINL